MSCFSTLTMSRDLRVGRSQEMSGVTWSHNMSQRFSLKNRSPLLWKAKRPASDENDENISVCNENLMFAIKSGEHVYQESSFLCHPYRSWEFHDGIKYQCPGVTVPKCRRFWRALISRHYDITMISSYISLNHCTVLRPFKSFTRKSEAMHDFQWPRSTEQDEDSQKKHSHHLSEEKLKMITSDIGVYVSAFLCISHRAVTWLYLHTCFMRGHFSRFSRFSRFSFALDTSGSPLEHGRRPLAVPAAARARRLSTEGKHAYPCHPCNLCNPCHQSLKSSQSLNRWSPTQIHIK